MKTHQYINHRDKFSHREQTETLRESVLIIIQIFGIYLNQRDKNHVWKSIDICIIRVNPVRRDDFVGYVWTKQIQSSNQVVNMMIVYVTFQINQAFVTFESYSQYLIIRKTSTL